MTDQIEHLLGRNGYLVHRSGNRVLLRRKLLVSWSGFAKLFLPGLTLMGVAYMGRSDLSPLMSILCFASGIVLAFIPFFNYLTSAYRSLAIDIHNRTLLFRSSFARAYRFSDISEIKLEVVSTLSGANSKSTTQDYVLSLLFENNVKEELLYLSITADQSEQVAFQLKDYFDVLLSQRL